MAKKNFEELDSGATEEDSSEVAKYDLLVKRDQVSGVAKGNRRSCYFIACSSFSVCMYSTVS